MDDVSQLPRIEQKLSQNIPNTSAAILEFIKCHYYFYLNIITWQFGFLASGTKLLFFQVLVSLLVFIFKKKAGVRDVPRYETPGWSEHMMDFLEHPESDAGGKMMGSVSSRMLVGFKFWPDWLVLEGRSGGSWIFKAHFTACSWTHHKHPSSKINPKSPAICLQVWPPASRRPRWWYVMDRCAVAALCWPVCSRGSTSLTRRAWMLVHNQPVACFFFPLKAKLIQGLFHTPLIFCVYVCVICTVWASSVCL